MEICLYSGYLTVATGLTWDQVVEAEEKANSSEAAMQLRFYRHAFKPEVDSVRRWSLVAKPRIYWEKYDGADDSG